MSGVHQWITQTPTIYQRSTEEGLGERILNLRLLLSWAPACYPPDETFQLFVAVAADSDDSVKVCKGQIEVKQKMLLWSAQLCGSILT